MNQNTKAKKFQLIFFFPLFWQQRGSSGLCLSPVHTAGCLPPG